MIRYFRRYLDEREKNHRWIDPRLYTVRVADIQSYLLARGWKPVAADRPGFLVFEEPTIAEGGPYYQFVPESEEWDGYPAQIHELLAGLAMIEDRYAGDVLTDMLESGSRNGSNGPMKGSSRESAPSSS